MLLYHNIYILLYCPALLGAQFQFLLKSTTHTVNTPSEMAITIISTNMKLALVWEDMVKLLMNFNKNSLLGLYSLMVGVSVLLFFFFIVAETGVHPKLKYKLVSFSYTGVSLTALTPCCVQNSDTRLGDIYLGSLVLCSFYFHQECEIFLYVNWRVKKYIYCQRHLDKLSHFEHGLRMQRRNNAWILFSTIVYKTKSKFSSRLLFEHLGSGSTLNHRCGTEI